MTTPLFLAVLLSAVIHAGWNIASKRTGGDLGVLWTGQLIAGVVMIPIALAFGELPAPTTEILLRLAVTGLLQAAYVILLSFAYKLGDLSSVYPVARGSSVALSALGSVLLLGDHLAPLGIAGIAAVGLGGATLGLVAKGHADLKALLFAVVIGADLAAGTLNDKVAVGSIHPLDYMAVMFLLAALGATPLVVKRGPGQMRRALREHPITVLLVGVGSGASYLIILFAFRHGPMAYIAGMRESSVVLGALWGFWRGGERLTRPKALALGLIVTGLVLIRLA